MARPKKEVIETEVNGNQECVAVLDQAALGMTKDPKTNEWLVIEIKYNTEGQIGDFQVLHRDRLRYIIQERFQVEIGKRIM